MISNPKYLLTSVVSSTVLRLQRTRTCDILKSDLIGRFAELKRCFDLCMKAARVISHVRAIGDPLRTYNSSGALIFAECV